MANLNTWQRIDRVLPGKPWGNGANGAGTISGSISNGVNWHGACSGTAGNTTLTVPNGWSWTGLALVHQTQGTGAGQWEIVYINSISGTTATLNKTLHYSYGTGAQCVLFQQFTTATVNASNVLAWNGSSGGIAVICAKDSITVSGMLNCNGGNGSYSTGGTPAGGSGGGFRGGYGRSSGSAIQYAHQGEGTSGYGGESNAANGNGGGGGGYTSSNSGGGGGGGHASSGSTGTASGVSGTGGSSAGASDLTNMVFGGGGGGAAVIPTNPVGGGGGGGGIIILISKSISASANVSACGGAGGNPNTDKTEAGGDGAGGSILCVCESASLGTSNLIAYNGNSSYGADASTGRIAVHYATSVTGTTTPTYTGIQDTTLKELGSTGNFIPFFM